MPDEFKPVTLVSPDGGTEIDVTTSTDYVNLRYGAGYSEKSSKSTPKKDEAKS